jgi:K+ transporter
MQVIILPLFIIFMEIDVVLFVFTITKFFRSIYFNVYIFLSISFCRVLCSSDELRLESNRSFNNRNLFHRYHVYNLGYQCMLMSMAAVFMCKISLFIFHALYNLDNATKNAAYCSR